MNTPSSLTDLREAAGRLDPDRVGSALASGLDLWRAADSPWLARLARAHPVYSAAVLERGVRMGVQAWSAQALRQLATDAARRGGPAPGLTAVWLAGSIPTASFHALLLPLLAGSAVYGRPSSHDPASARLFTASLRAVDPGVADALEVGRDDTLLDQADALVAYGSNETIESLRGRAPAGCLFVGYGHKLSAAAVGPAADLESAATAVALDAALFDGRGCLSPAYVFVAQDPQGRADRFAEHLADALGALTETLPRGALSATEQVALRERWAREALREGARVLSPVPRTDWAVLLAPAGTWPEPGLLRFVPVLPVRDLDELGTCCAQLHPHLSSLAHVGWEAGADELEKIVRRGGGARCCAPGRLQAPPLDWRQDEREPLPLLLRKPRTTA
ncbi:MAG: aldehyde dehydrogenase family protein [Myxococcota bacterium]